MLGVAVTASTLAPVVAPISWHRFVVAPKEFGNLTGTEPAIVSVGGEELAGQFCVSSWSPRLPGVLHEQAGIDETIFGKHCFFPPIRAGWPLLSSESVAHEVYIEPRISPLDDQTWQSSKNRTDFDRRIAL